MGPSEPGPAGPAAGVAGAASEPVHVACLCAAWCRLCDSYAPVFEAALQGLGVPGLRMHWIDIEDEAELVGEFDVETFPTLVVADAQRVRFAGALTPQPETLQRVLRAVLAAGGDAGAAADLPEGVEAFAARLRQRAGRVL
ncbi:MAG: thioredoxin family protein [Burkholderiales bacterium]|nr:thioredoxin family protein [Burkholderiales bacterium]MDE2565187.1 thioredoxin family protein [Burkholderiales bacterium]